MTCEISQSKIQGREIFFSTEEGNFIGIVHTVNSEKVTMSDVLSLPNYKRIGTRTFSIHDILNHKLISEQSVINNTNVESALNVSSDDYVNRENYDLNLPPHICDRLPLDNVIINYIDEEFYSAVNHFKKQDMIGLALEGSNINRFGTLEWLTMSTSSCTFLFDVQKLGSAVFSEGVKIILESDKVLKVIHDCRLIADCLLHQFGVKLANVYDTQVAGFVVNAQKNSVESITNQVKSLDYCLAVYLQIPEEYLCLDMDMLGYRYSVRPLSHNIRNILIKNVIYLRRLKQEMDAILRVPFRRCVDVHLQAILKKTDQDIILHPPKLDSISEEILIENIQVLQCDERLAKVPPSKPSPKSNDDPQKRYEKDCRRYQSGSSATPVEELQLCLNLNSENLNIIDNRFNRSEMMQFLLNKMFVDEIKDVPSLHHDNVTEIDNSSLLSTEIDFGISTCSSVDLSNDSHTIESTNMCNLFFQNGNLQEHTCEHSRSLCQFKNSFPLKDKKNMIQETTSNMIRKHEEKAIFCSDGRLSQVDDVSTPNSRFDLYNEILMKKRMANMRKETTQNTALYNLISSSELVNLSYNSEKDVPNTKLSNYFQSDSSSSNLLSKGEMFVEPKNSAQILHCSFSRNNATSMINKQQPVDENILCGNVLPVTRKSKFFTVDQIDGWNSSSDTDTLDLCPTNESDEDPWTSLRSTFSEVGPPTDEVKLTFIPSGMGC